MSRAEAGNPAPVFSLSGRDAAWRSPFSLGVGAAPRVHPTFGDSCMPIAPIGKRDSEHIQTVFDANRSQAIDQLIFSTGAITREGFLV